MPRAIGQNSMTPKGNNTLNFGLARDQVVHPETAANLYASSVKQIIFTQSWQLNDFKQELKKKLNSFYGTKAGDLLTRTP